LRYALASLPDFDLAALDAYLRRVMRGWTRAGAREDLRRQSNPTYFLKLPDAPHRSRIRRRVPLAVGTRVDREHRIMQALENTNVPVPQMLALCTDPGVIGRPFYVMARVAGRVFNDCSLSGAARAERRPCILRLAETLAQLHHVDWQAAGPHRLRPRRRLLHATDRALGEAVDAVEDLRHPRHRPSDRLAGRKRT